MNDKERAAMKQALGALEAAGYGGSYAAIDLREALAEPDIETMTLTQIAARHEQAKQEPVFYNPSPTCARHIEGVPVGTRITAPVRTKDLTDDEISRLWYDSSYGDSGIDFARAVIAKYKEKNRG